MHINGIGFVEVRSDLAENPRSDLRVVTHNSPAISISDIGMELRGTDFEKNISDISRTNVDASWPYKVGDGAGRSSVELKQSWGKLIVGPTSTVAVQVQAAC